MTDRHRPDDPVDRTDHSLSASDLFSLTAARHLSYWDYDPQAVLGCPACAWQGTGAGLEEIFTALFDVKCPECDCILLVVDHPTDEETRLAAAAGNARAIAGLPHLDGRAELQRLRDRHELRDPATLPDLDGESIVIDWDFLDQGGHSWTVLRCGDEELWREPAYFEGAERFRVVARLLQSAYGDRFIELRPTPVSEMYLYGDRYNDKAVVQDINRTLGARRAV